MQDVNICKHLRNGSQRASAPRANGLEKVHLKVGKRKQIPVREHFSSETLILCEGWAFRYRQVSASRRQILTILIPGDVFSAFSLFEARPAYSVEALTDVSFCQIKRADLVRELTARPRLFDALGKACVAEHDEINETILDLGRRDAQERVLHFITRLTRRLDARGLASGDRRYSFPLTSAQIADAVGLVPEEVDEAVARLAQDSMIELAGGVLRIPEPERLGIAAVHIEA